MKFSELQLSNRARTSRPQIRTTPEDFESDEGTLSITEAID